MKPIGKQLEGGRMSTIAWIIVVVAVVVLAALAWAGRKRNLEQRRVEADAHREDAKERGLRAERASLAAEEQLAQARRQQLDAEELSAVAEREKAAAEQSHERARQVDPDIAEPEDARR